MKTIAIGDLGEFWYGDYKEPFVQLEGAVPGYPAGVIPIEPATGKLMCAKCGKTYHRLDAHTKPKHGLAAAEYKAEVGLLTGSALVSESVREVRIRNGLRSPHLEKGRRQGPGGARSRAFVHRLEYQNKTGRCRAQVLEVARQIVRLKGRLTMRDLARHGIGQRTVAMHWGSLDRLGAEANAAGVGPIRYSKAGLLVELRSLAAELGRTPSPSDLRRQGGPTLQTFVNHFGSWTSAIREAGLVPLRDLPAPEELDARIMIAYHTTLSANRTARVVGVGVARVLLTLHRFGYPFRAGYSGPGRREWAVGMVQAMGFGTSCVSFDSLKFGEA